VDWLTGTVAMGGEGPGSFASQGDR